jgi:hypothetical protein
MIKPLFARTLLEAHLPTPEEEAEAQAERERIYSAAARLIGEVPLKKIVQLRRRATEKGVPVEHMLPRWLDRHRRGWRAATGL